MESITDILTTNPRLFLVTLILLIVAAKYLLTREKNRYRLPPGPFSLPVVGTLPFLGTDIREPLRRLSEKYGDIVTVYFGSRRVIVLNSYEAIKEAFVKNGNSFIGRPFDLFFVKDIHENRGVVCNQGSSWKEQKKVAHNIFRDFGMGSTYMEERIQNETHHMIQAFSMYANKRLLSPYKLIAPAVANVIYSVCYEHRQEYDNPDFIYCLKIMDRSVKLLSNSGIVDVLPFVRYLPGDISGYKEVMMLTNYMKAEYRRFVDEHVKTYQDGVVRDFTDAYLKAMYKEQAQGNPTHLSLDELATVLGDLFRAGTGTTTNTLCWGLIYMLHYPDVQQKVQEEIDTVVGKSTPCMAHKQRMPYTEACIQEIQRLGDIVPLGVPHRTVEDVDIMGYEIPADTMVISHLYSVHHDEKVWPHPRRFDPTRFLDDDGKIHKREKLIPFSMGKRVCLGESLARMELFLLFVSLLQNFVFKLPEGDSLPSLVGHRGINNMPNYYEVHLTPRS